MNRRKQSQQRVEVFSAAGKEKVGVDPVDVEQVLAVVEPPVSGPPGFGLVVKLAKPHRLDQLKLPPGMPLQDSELDGQPYLQSQHPMSPSPFMADGQPVGPF